MDRGTLWKNRYVCYLHVCAYVCDVYLGICVMCFCGHVGMWVYLYVGVFVCGYARMCVCVYVMWMCLYVGMSVMCDCGYLCM